MRLSANYLSETGLFLAISVWPEMTSVLISGASGGIGQAVSHLARHRGWEPLCVGRSSARLQERLPGFRHLEADVSDEQQVTQLFEELSATGTSPSALVHCVGSTLVGPLDRLSQSQYAETMNTNLTTAVLMTSQFISLLKKSAKPGSTSRSRFLLMFNNPNVLSTLGFFMG